MGSLQKLLKRNKVKAAYKACRDPEYFSRHANVHKPTYLWIGCVDSRVAAERIMDVEPGEILTFRNIANQCQPGESSIESVIELALEKFGIDQILVCGHYDCGGITQAVCGHGDSPLNSWVDPIRDLHSQFAKELDSLEKENKINTMSRINVAAQVAHLASHPVVKQCWEQGRKLEVHGVMFDTGTGDLLDLEISQSAPSTLEDSALLEKLATQAIAEPARA
ncbi:carbonic anhydrase [Dongshaea marina]|uniref:carbonic anhydrase n=1 Tax=Dongshaea marina TaxID=2047966 RepID=UPI000D3E1713|nr:carbonic anhydrase [Dongshaea marina]